MSEFDYNQDYDQVYQEADYIARQNAQQALMAADNTQVAQALLTNTMSVEQLRQQQERQWATEQTNAAEAAIRERLPEWPSVGESEKGVILQRAARNGQGKPFSTIGFVDEIVDAVEELRREQAKAAEKEKRQADQTFADELKQSHTERSWSSRRGASWVHETLDPQAKT